MMVGVGRGACVRQMAKWIGIRSPPPLPSPPQGPPVEWNQAMAHLGLTN